MCEMLIDGIYMENGSSDQSNIFNLVATILKYLNRHAKKLGALLLTVVNKLLKPTYCIDLMFTGRDEQ